MTILIQFLRSQQTIVLHLHGVLDGAAAWRVIQLCSRLSPRRQVILDFDGVERLMTFGAAVLGSRMANFGERVTLQAVRPEHIRLLRDAGALSQRQSA